MKCFLKLLLVLLAASSLFSGERLYAGNNGHDPPGNPSHGKSPGYGNPASKGRSRGNQAGNYSVAVAGDFSGSGAASVGGTISLSVPVVADDGTKGTLVASGLVLNQSYFKGTGTVMGKACIICGRVDLPDAQDTEETDQQAVTARMTGTFRDLSGKVGRIVAVQQITLAGGGKS